ncbi:hypothetical protein GPUN_2304 [Glaciecola punicea ACAM 611]|uniref:Uncharacterized protein n=1 Tax=Glaciecola punicea ACAM 611 TaxID=1121923 RepID=H5TDP2_9ALTE|nr:hypothetical protein GPUN_2304 [Glaciecola punicea ACAM 611]
MYYPLTDRYDSLVLDIKVFKIQALKRLIIVQRLYGHANTQVNKHSDKTFSKRKCNE